MLVPVVPRFPSLVAAAHASRAVPQRRVVEVVGGQGSSEILIKIMTRLDSYRGDVAVTTLMYRVAANPPLDRTVGEQRGVTGPPDLAGSPPENDGRPPSPNSNRLARTHELDPITQAGHADGHRCRRDPGGLARLRAVRCADSVSRRQGRRGWPSVRLGGFTARGERHHVHHDNSESIIGLDHRIRGNANSAGGGAVSRGDLRG